MTRGNGLRAALYYRFHGLLPCFSHPLARRAWFILVRGFWLIYFGFILLVLALRYVVLPHIEDYHARIEQVASERFGQAVSIGRIEASWEGINPDLTLLDVRVADAEGRPALAFSRIEAILSWWTVPSAQLRLRLLRINEPTLHLRRDTLGNFFIAGIPVSREKGERNVGDWVMEQRRIRIQGATVIWEDDQRTAPPLILEDLNFALDNDGKRHRFGLTALPPAAMAAKIDVRGDFRGTDLGRMNRWSGQAYAEIDYADLSVWRQWIDYPVALPRGRGAMRAWLGFSGGGLREITADMALQDVSLRLSQDLPELELEQVSGRLQARFPVAGLEVNGRSIALVSRADGRGGEPIVVEPTDFHVDWRPEGKGTVGSASASRLDLGALVRLAAYLPVDERSRQLLDDLAPRGRVSGLGARWKSDAETLQTYSLEAEFADLAVKAKGNIPGASGMSGAIQASEKLGNLTLRSLESSIDLPGVFSVPLIRFDSLDAQARWKIDKGQLEVELAHAEFAGPEAAGSAKGSYRTVDEGPGIIDMTAELNRADARAVWRYMPLVVGEGARHWLRDSLLAGHSDDARLTLKGNLADFPFLDKRKGQFLVTVKADDVVLDYAKGWPRIEGIHGDLRFEGNGMVVDARRGTILGAKLVNTRAEIPDFDAPISTLIVKGQAEGPTSEFLKFIDQSPVAEQIDHFTEDMRAVGNGHLDIKLRIPLDETRLGDSRIEGDYRLANNEVTVDPALPAFRQVNGSIRFSGNELQVPEINASLLGGPVRVKGGTQKDGKVLITANGSVNIAQLRKQADSPLLERLSGTTPYRGEVRINKRNADLLVESSMVGLELNLPEPFKKASGDPLPLRFEKKFLPPATASNGRKTDAVVRDQISAALGNAVSLQWVRRKTNEGFVTEKGAIAVGRPLQLPEKGVLLGVTTKRLDLDAWQRVLPAGGGNAPSEASSSSPPALMPDTVSLKTSDLVLHGHHLNDVDLMAAASAAAQWKIRLNSRQAGGDLLWNSEGKGKLTARLGHLTLDAAASPDGTSGAPVAESTENLPALDIVAEDFSVKTRRFGRLELQAVNEGGVWRLNRILSSNPFGSFSGSGQWQQSPGPGRTQLAFRIDSKDVGGLLGRMGYPDTVRAGTAQLEGKLGWDGAPTEPDYASMSGEMTVEAGKGQFLKLDPGAAGKLLGLVSLQNLPRRMSLDFHDVFSEGFAFDTIASKLSVRNGVMRTDRLQIDGPSARVVMRGEVDLRRETQRLNVNVLPELGGTAALGVATVVNPAVGVAAWVAHKILQNPLNQMFGYEYLVTGTWDDPKVEKISAPAASQEPSPSPPSVPETPGDAK